MAGPRLSLKATLAPAIDAVRRASAAISAPRANGNKVLDQSGSCNARASIETNP